MRITLCSLIVLAAVTGVAPAQQKEVVPHPVTITFYISGITSDKCIEEINASLKKVPSFAKIEGLTVKSGFANVSFDSHVASFHQIAQAIAYAGGNEAKPCATTIKIRVPEYAQGDNAAKVDAIFQKLDTKVKVEATDKAKGEFVVRFLPLKVDADKKGPQGFNGGQLGHPIHDPAPKGLGLKFSIVKETIPPADK
jgi:copper chaperone CopZ